MTIHHSLSHLRPTIPVCLLAKNLLYSPSYYLLLKLAVILLLRQESIANKLIIFNDTRIKKHSERHQTI